MFAIQIDSPCYEPPPHLLTSLNTQTHPMGEQHGLWSIEIQLKNNHTTRCCTCSHINNTKSSENELRNIRIESE